MELEDFFKYQHLYGDEIRLRQRDALLLKFSDSFQNKLRYSNTHMKVFKALDNGCDVYRVVEQLMDSQLEMEELMHELMAWSSPEILKKARDEAERKRAMNKLKYNPPNK